MLGDFQIWPFAMGYLLGSIPFGLVLVKAMGKGDIRATGSGNIGATNAVRAAGKKVGALVFLLDALKGVAAVLIARHFMGGQAELFAAAGALIGHLYPVWLKFRGGKGVATLFGILFALDWRIGAIALGIWVAAFFITKMSSAGGLLAAASAPVTALLLDREPLFNLLLGITLLIWWKHRANIARIVDGSEPRFGAKKDAVRAEEPPARPS